MQVNHEFSIAKLIILSRAPKHFARYRKILDVPNGYLVDQANSGGSIILIGISDLTIELLEQSLSSDRKIELKNLSGIIRHKAGHLGLFALGTAPSFKLHSSA